MYTDSRGSIIFGHYKASDLIWLQNNIKTKIFSLASLKNRIWKSCKCRPCTRVIQNEAPPADSTVRYPKFFRCGGSQNFLRYRKKVLRPPLTSHVKFHILSFRPKMGWEFWRHFWNCLGNFKLWWECRFHFFNFILKNISNLCFPHQGSVVHKSR